MSVIELELTEREAIIFDEVRAKIDKTAAFLAGLSHEERLAWLEKRRFVYPISFEQEIAGTVYTVNAHFSERATETVEQKTIRVINENSSL